MPFFASQGEEPSLAVAVSVEQFQDNTRCIWV